MRTPVTMGDNKGKDEESTKKWVEETFEKQMKSGDQTKDKRKQNEKFGEGSSEECRLAKESDKKKSIEKISDTEDDGQNYKRAGKNNEEHEEIGVRESASDRYQEDKPLDPGLHLSNHMDDEGSTT
uniref:Uncharacterized protein n=1 Tax=Solanum tuberosum TaxID=4113 RepID=M1DZA8_SOLTU